jgi:hypothetical protein
MEMKKWIVIVSARDVHMDDWGNSFVCPEYITDDEIKIFNSQKEAFDACVTEAEDEVKALMYRDEDDDEEWGHSFGIPEDDLYENMEQVRVEYYNDDGDDTYVVTRRTIKSIDFD